MIDTVPRPDASLPELLASRARHASDTRLALDAVVGFLVVIVIAFWRGPGWLLLAGVATCFFAFGMWGIADRELGERGTTASPRVLVALRIVRVAAGVLGALGTFIVLATGLGIALGRMIS